MAAYLPEHDVKNVRELELKGIKNGQLLGLIEAGSFDVFISADRNMRNEQNWLSRPFATLLLSTNNWKLIKLHVPSIKQSVEQVKPGEVRELFCGRFVPRKFRRPSEP